jgi:hypothetical protein
VVAGAGFCFMADKCPEGAGSQSNKINTLTQFSPPDGAGPKQQLLDLTIERREEVDGLDMGILLLSWPHEQQETATGKRPSPNKINNSMQIQGPR